MNKLIILSGCSGGGKSTLLYELERLGYSVIPEVGREVYRQRLKVKKDFTAQDYLNICEEIIERSIDDYKKAQKIKSPKAQSIFFDRSFLECISYYQNLKIEDSHKYDYLITDLRYFPTIFMTPPWKEIHHQDDERLHSFENAVADYERYRESFSQYGYRILELPKVSVKERVDFMISWIGS